MTFDKIKSIDVETKIRMLQRWVLVMSYAYYIEDTNIAADNVYDANTQQLLKLMAENPMVKTDYSYVFKDFTSGTGFDLCGKLKKAHRALIERDARLCIRRMNGR